MGGVQHRQVLPGRGVVVGDLAELVVRDVRDVPDFRREELVAPRSSVDGVELKWVVQRAPRAWAGGRAPRRAARAVERLEGIERYEKL